MNNKIYNATLIFSLFVGSAGLASANSTTSNLQITGSMRSTSSCTLSIPSNIYLGANDNNAVVEKEFSLVVNCTSGQNYSVSAPYNTSVMIGPDTNYVSVLTHTNQNIGDTPVAAIGAGSQETHAMKVQLHGEPNVNTKVPESSVGAFAANVPITLSY